ncbi:hypothetical protein K523DRAFT_333356 [Schizophyllum commune Tattone D]|nr:hypothetical protein K523DRAFT_333356 [Schizophyllum commune Tattone D]
MCQYELFQGDPFLISQVISAWPGLYEWLGFLFPMNHRFDYPMFIGNARHTLTLALSSASAIVSSVTTGLKLSRAQWENVLDTQHSVLGLAVSLYIGSVSLSGLHTQNAQTDILLLPLGKSVLSLAKTLHMVAHHMKRKDLAALEILELLQGHPRRLLRAMGHCNQILIHSEDANELLRVHLSTVQLTTELFPGQFSRVLLKSLLEVLVVSAKDVLLMAAYIPLAHMCCRNCHALRLAVKYGAIPCLDAVLKYSTQDFSEEVFYRALTSSLVHRDMVNAVSHALEGYPLGGYYATGLLEKQARACHDILAISKDRWANESVKDFITSRATVSNVPLADSETRFLGVRLLTNGTLVRRLSQYASRSNVA